jgi:hypothetical protein
VADAVPADVFLGTFTHDCSAALTDAQKAWPVADAVPADVFLGTFTHDCASGRSGEQVLPAVSPDAPSALGSVPEASERPATPSRL